MKRTTPALAFIAALVLALAPAGASFATDGGTPDDVKTSESTTDTPEPEPADQKTDPASTPKDNQGDEADKPDLKDEAPIKPEPKPEPTEPVKSEPAPKPTPDKSKTPDAPRDKGDKPETVKGTISMSWFMPVGSTPSNVGWPQSVNDPRTGKDLCQPIWKQHDVYKYKNAEQKAAIEAFDDDGVLSQGEDSKYVISYSFSEHPPLKYNCEEPPPAPKVVVPTVTFTQPTCEDPTVKTVFENTDEISYELTDGTVAPGETVTVTATAAEGFIFGGDKTTQEFVGKFNPLPTDCEPVTPPVDFCPDVPGNQPVGTVCEPVPPPKPPTPPVTDECPDIPGTQTADDKPCVSLIPPVTLVNYPDEPAEPKQPRTPSTPSKSELPNTGGPDMGLAAAGMAVLALGGYLFRRGRRQPTS